MSNCLFSNLPCTYVSSKRSDPHIKTFSILSRVRIGCWISFIIVRCSLLKWVIRYRSSCSTEWLFVGVCRAMLLSTLWTAASLSTNATSRQRLRSASRHQLIVPRHSRTKFGCQAFSVAGPTAWNSLPDYLRDTSLSEDTFGRSLKSYLFALY